MSAWQILRPLTTVDLAEAVEARAATDGPISLADAAVGSLAAVAATGVIVPPGLTTVAVVVTVRVVEEMRVVVGTMTASQGVVVCAAGTTIVKRVVRVTQIVRGAMTAALVETNSVVETSVGIVIGIMIVKTAARKAVRLAAGTPSTIAMNARRRTLPSNLRRLRLLVSQWRRWTSTRKLFRHQCVQSCVVSPLILPTSLRAIWSPLLNFSTRTRFRPMPTLRPLGAAPRDCRSCAKWPPRPHTKLASTLLPSTTTVRFDA
ncbi:hypothetical protein E5345_12895 [Propionibacterium sp. NM47_B9-13]|uniref:Uncharacterized protein n=1 Tax=Cutibacterium modestum HL044PA1 TaxID=765109 RepID=A0ABP2K4X6_9ACTN|nr:hypothetical protein HMPREF9621_00054 [Cutibacterium modestum HL037PA2]EFS91122.1 hypothetical protein HMPREF9607_02748 [Cutibacterium modestum HL044PA1]EFT16805.1 hypothetical protein HMPREF9622_00076 [Cutibacterium modestum HL037PA3]REB74546.1 hypothetical protein CP877_01290 [Cutibacterium modestum]TGY27273.1 hypothetical protein E5345_12895 [Propionibacterium sp. NM47_B9-13]